MNSLDGTYIFNDHKIDLSCTTSFVNSLICKLSQLTAPTMPLLKGAEINEREYRQHARRSQYHSTSAFPSSQLTNLKPLMLTLHCIFPNEFLLALDIVDRGLVRRIQTEDQAVLVNNVEPEVEPQRRNGRGTKSTREEDFFFVTSASATSNNSSLSTSQPEAHQKRQWQEKGYEVRLQAWNCTCPAFTISAFRNLGPEPSSPLSPSESRSQSRGESRHKDEGGTSACDHAGDADADVGRTNAYSFGGTLSLHPESAPAVCKHILACLLAALCPGLGGDGGGKRLATLGMEEVAALCAGWGG
ncbi:uncharacterized protein BJX67DRAFT_363331 [Aspergillus lucknowensis]|uniref:SWIM-type domain-containing protein n=1 Tax=Aspergillus lucknowensis TaxID=176173 RepID=A0ABR4LGD8_9EURO